jgi:branched-subunit amino acid aminotransferase/4-amino-4-deoxychorismate lyase
MATVFLNGAFVALDDARLSALDAGLQHAVGLFETMLGGVREGAGTKPWIVDLDKHMERLAASANELGLSPDLHAQALADAVTITVAGAGLARARIRLTITGGDLNLLSRPDASGKPRQVDPTVLIVAQPATQYPREMLERGVTVAVADSKANPFNVMEGHKTLNYWWRLRELQAAGRKGAAEALVFDVTNHLSGGCVSNVFLVKDGGLLTPIARNEEGFGAEGPTGDLEEKRRGGTYLPSPVLPGITRSWVLDRADLAGSTARRGMLTINDLLAADEVFLTNSSWGVLPVVQVEGKPIGDGAVGPLARRFVEEWASWTG